MIQISIDTTLTLFDAYGHQKINYVIVANTPTAVLVPLHREVYKDTEGKTYHIYDGEGVLDVFDVYLPEFVLSASLADDFDAFLLSRYSKFHQNLFESILQFLDYGKTLLHPKIDALQNIILKKAGVNNAE